MNIVIWIVAGGIVAGVAYRVMQWNESRGLTVAVVIGAVAGYLGGGVLAPMFVPSSGIAAGEFNPFALIVAACTALGASYVSNLLHERFGA